MSVEYTSVIVTVAGYSLLSMQEQGLGWTK
jgi:hypothetical protein